ncbi:MAG: DUF4398 domain-containing protein [Gammaproteobacteria bacterium]|nr:DUF4398 domain-containing protein [Gammaproteobacteria bacterium]MBT8110244.1 DUF4398 domain-containing protein [Gammaproteobacteria bacterium]NND48164.1 DUF4398 domain-containing protein [Woeseiaceae bacterium]NNL44947.1 DUF4398 domain-containing protein [Woeseiaceae bacterium]
MKTIAPKSLTKALLVAAVLLMTGCETAPPVQEMSDARQAIAVAKEAGAAEKAAIHLKAAESYLQRAQQKLNDHQYSLARYDAKQAKMKALDALKASEAVTGSAEDDSQ